MVLQRNLRDAVANSCLISTISYYNEQYSCVENFAQPATKLLLAKKDMCDLRFEKKEKDSCRMYKYIIKLIVFFLYEIDIISPAS